jgi:hypothetical protein
MANCELIKVAIIRQQGDEVGKPAPVYLNCPCGAKPPTDINTKLDVKCICGKTYTYNGWIIN